ncbi:MAG TPA: hypothetical protein PLM06_10555 [Anaerolineae bacterium]|nr:hypothetical protein [Anaerolineae bacterium]
MEQTKVKAGAQISRRAFIQSAVILLVLMVAAGVATRWVPAGRYARVLEGGREVIDPATFEQVARPDYPIWRWFVAPVEVLGSADGLALGAIILFILMVGGAFAMLERCGILKAVILRLVRLFGGRKYLLLLVVSLFFMALGGFFGIFEEVVPLIPLMLALSYYLGWDTLVGLGMSILATNVGFSAAVTNPFTIGVAQQLAGLPLFSGAWLRLLIFAVMYGIFAVFLVNYARRVERHPESSPVFAGEQAERARYQPLDVTALEAAPALGAALRWFLVFLVLILAVLVSVPFVPALSQFALPLLGVLFLSAGLGAGRLSGFSWQAVGAALWEGVVGIAPGVILILMAASVKHIVVSGGIMDTLLHDASGVMASTGPFGAALLIYVTALFIELFISSGSAKAFLILPILLPLADLAGVTRQVAVLAYCFGDGFSNLAYPTNPVLLISLGMTTVSYPKWLRWLLRLWIWVILASVAFLGLAVALHYGPF